jgi:hypothetical protein
MSQTPQAVLAGAAEPLVADERAHDQAQAQMQSEMQDECAEQQGSSQALQAAAHLASSNLESPPEQSHAQKPSTDLAAASPLSPGLPPHDVVDAQSPAAVCVTASASASAEDSTAIPMSLNTGGKIPNQGLPPNYPISSAFWWLR